MLNCSLSSLLHSLWKSQVINQWTWVQILACTVDMQPMQLFIFCFRLVNECTWGSIGKVNSDHLDVTLSLYAVMIGHLLSLAHKLIWQLSNKAMHSFSVCPQLWSLIHTSTYKVWMQDDTLLTLAYSVAFSLWYFPFSKFNYHAKCFHHTLHTSLCCIIVPVCWNSVFS